MGEKHVSLFEQIRHLDENGKEFWSARELSKVLDYTRWETFPEVIKKAETACQNSGEQVADHFRQVTKMVELGSGAKRRVKDWELSRYGCYLTVQNADPTKEIVALGQTYFAVQTRRQELADLRKLSAEEYKRLAYRIALDEQTVRLAEQAALAGIVTADDFAVFEDFGLVGLYGGLKAADIALLKGLKPGEDIRNYMSSEELADNLFRSAQTNRKLDRDEVSDKDTANLTHFQVGQEVRAAIERIDGLTPEKLPRPGTSLEEVQELARRRRELEEGHN